MFGCVSSQQFVEDEANFRFMKGVLLTVSIFAQVVQT